MPRILALDPGEAAFGASVLDATGAIVAADVLSTEPHTIRPRRPRKPRDGKSKRRRLPVVGGMARDTDRRIGELWRWLIDFARPYGCVAAVAESPGGSALGFTAAIALGTANSIARIATIELGLPLERVGVREWRRTFVPGKATIEDQELYDAIGRVAADRVGEELSRRGRKASLAVHAIDSVGIGRWSINFSPLVRRALGIDVGGL